MSTYPRWPHTRKAGIVLLDPVTTQISRVIVMQYNPDQLTRTLQVQAAAADAGDRVEALRLKGPPIETFKLETEIDATDQLEQPEQHRTAVDVGIFPQLAALESLISPGADQIALADGLLRAGSVEIAPVEAPLALFIWSVQRVVPVRVTEFSIAEEAFDVSLNPIRARVSLTMRVLSIADFGFDHPGGKLFMAYLRNKESLANRLPGGDLRRLGFQR